MIYLYAICDQHASLPASVRGVDLAPVTTLCHQGISAVVSETDQPDFAPAPQRLWQHERVVESLMTKHAVLPARFATVFESANEVLHQLQVQQYQYLEELERVRGCVELGLRVLRMVEPPVVPAETENDGIPHPDLLASEKNGHTFEIARKAAEMQRDALRRRDESLGEILNRSLVAHASEYQAHVESQTGTVLKASYLVERSRLSEMQAVVHRLRETYKNLHFLCTGPWPPYHFVHPIVPEPHI
ncbi:MAG TPA: GvpL/GvpF family gas vesicle protein [Rhodothermales bacterium]|nr:GvpL/GvpF family gas vesicle protein [Rhodothermales bacterium]